MLPERQTVPSLSQMLELDESGPALEDAGELSTFEFQKQAPLEITHSMADLIAEFGLASFSQSLAAAVDTLVGEVGEQEDQILASLTPSDYQRLVEARDKLNDVVGSDKKHLLAPLMDFIGDLIEKWEEEYDMTVEERDSGTRPTRGLAAAYDDDEPEYTTDMLIVLNSDYEATDEERDSGTRPKTS